MAQLRVADGRDEAGECLSFAIATLNYNYLTMSAALAYQRPTYVTVEQYLAIEEKSPVRHEFVASEMYAMAGSTKYHNMICGNLFADIHRHLRGKPCKPYMQDVKLQIWAGQDVIYYPDLMVVCDPTDDDPVIARKPKVIIEVLSPSTRRIDEQEKLLTYFHIDSLEEYILVEQSVMTISIFRRANEWKREEVHGRDALLELVSLGFSIPLISIYEGVFES